MAAVRGSDLPDGARGETGPDTVAADQVLRRVDLRTMLVPD